MGGGVGAQPDAVTEHVFRELLNVFGVDVGTVVAQQRPHLGDASPRDRGTRRCTEVHAGLHEIGRRAARPPSILAERPARANQTPNVLRQHAVQEYVAGDHGTQFDNPLLRHQRLQPNFLEIELDQLFFLVGRQVGDVHDHREPIGRRFRQRKGALPQLHRIHRRDRKTECREFASGGADRNGAILQSFEERALRFQRDAVDFIEENHFCRRQRSELGNEGASRRVDHLKAHHLRGLEVGSALNTGELGVADCGEDHAEEGLADAGHAAEQKVPGIDLTL